MGFRCTRWGGVGFCTESYGPCPSLVASPPGMQRSHALARSAQEARELVAVMAGGRVTNLDLPEHEPLTMC